VFIEGDYKGCCTIAGDYFVRPFSAIELIKKMEEVVE
jgi:hypothetical protein